MNSFGFLLLPILVPAWLRRASFNEPISDQELVVSSYCSTSARALGHCPQPASVIVSCRGPFLNPKAWDSSHAWGRSATPASSQLLSPGFQDSTAVWGTRLPAWLRSPPMA